jgi:hypothetical protein
MKDPHWIKERSNPLSAMFKLILPLFVNTHSLTIVRAYKNGPANRKKP